MIAVSFGGELPERLLGNYLNSLVNCFYKILPIRESEEPSLSAYMQSLRAELVGCKGLVVSLDNDARFMTLISILQYLIDNPDCPVRTVKREVFKAIRICHNLKESYGEVCENEHMGHI